MNRIIVLLTVLTLTSAITVVPSDIRLSWVQVVAPHFGECVCKTGVNPIQAHTCMSLTRVYNNYPLKCYIKCLSDKLNLWDAQTGSWTVTEFVRQIKGVTPEIGETCKALSEQEVDLNKRAFQMYLCIVYAVSVPVPPTSKYEEATTERSRKY